MACLLVWSGVLPLYIDMSSHGDGLGDHNMFQKENYFEEACRIPFIVSWPAHTVLGSIKGTDENRLVGQADLFGIITAAAGAEELRDGISVMAMLAGGQDLNDDGFRAGREYFYGTYSEPGSHQFKIMVRSHSHKYIYMANGARELLFDLVSDTHEQSSLCALSAVATAGDAAQDDVAQLLRAMRAAGAAYLATLAAGAPALDASSTTGFVEHAFVARPLHRIMQMAGDLGVSGFPEDPAEVLERWPARL